MVVRIRGLKGELNIYNDPGNTVLLLSHSPALKVIARVGSK